MVAWPPKIVEDNRCIDIIGFDNIVISIEIGITNDLYIGIVISAPRDLYRGDILVHIGTDNSLYDDQVDAVSSRFDHAQIVHAIVTVKVEIGNLQVRVIESPLKIGQISGFSKE